MNTISKKSSTTTPASVHSTAKPFFAKSKNPGFFRASRAASVENQTKMKVNQPGDKFEQQADKTASQVMRVSSEEAQKSDEEKFQKAEGEKLQKAEGEELQKAEEEEVQKAEDEELQKAEDEEVQKAEDEELQKAEDEEVQKAEDEEVQKAEDEEVQKAEDEKLQKQEISTEAQENVPAFLMATDNAPTSLQSRIRNKITGGEPLSSDVRSFMELRFKADFSNVRVHTDAESAKLSKQLKARAFTYRNHIFFSKDQYQPGTSKGKTLLAHELTHTIQKGQSVQYTQKVRMVSGAPVTGRLNTQAHDEDEDETL